MRNVWFFLQLMQVYEEPRLNIHTTTISIPFNAAYRMEFSLYAKSIRIYLQIIAFV